ncbi:WSC domain-containing protein [Ephemerocybe angulata]|uniref:WSC domain-containing protein n=1 Tax=Ephemerocybe angulata TaxID=980116 RepID=A0A8H6IHI8_9AGAR|nr:WSC domain-containing protein [Tulosesus angulatus]
MIRLFAPILLLSSCAFAVPTLEARQSPSIKQAVGTWQFKGCYKDFGPRILTFRYDVPAGNNAERCTALCASHGYGLAGLEYGTECWCDNYLPYGDRMPNTDCSFACPGDASELCGAGNRMVIYQNSAATPPSTSACINWRDGFTFGNNVFYAVPKTLGAGPTTKLYAIPTNPFVDPIYYSIISTCPAGCPYTDYYNFGIVDGVLTSYNNRVLPPNVGDSQAFIFTWPQPGPGYNQYCAKPNPISPDGPFIGHPLLSVNGNTNLWGLCPNSTANGRLDIVYSPVANHNHYTKSQCQDVYIQINPYA